MQSLRALGTIVASAMAISPLPAQESIRVGDRVRLRVAAEVTRAPKALPTTGVVGIVRTIAADTLHLDPATTGGTAVPRIFIQRIELSLGPPSRRESAQEIALIGALLGLMIPPVLPKRTAAFLRGPDEGVIVGITFGFLSGALVGFLFPYERWRPAWIPER